MRIAAHSKIGAGLLPLRGARLPGSPRLTPRFRRNDGLAGNSGLIALYATGLRTGAASAKATNATTNTPANVKNAAS